jgi:hypothetical protein
MNYALISNGLVVNMIVWDGQTPYAPPAGVQLVASTSDSVSMGWSYADGQFIAPPEAELVPESAPDQPTSTGAQEL